jgi:hypothetical protein
VVLHFHKYVGNLPNFISHTIPNFQKRRSLTVATLPASFQLVLSQTSWSQKAIPGSDFSMHNQPSQKLEFGSYSP